MACGEEVGEGVGQGSAKGAGTEQQAAGDLADDGRLTEQARQAAADPAHQQHDGDLQREAQEVHLA